VIVGAYLYDNGQTDEGKVFVYLGSSTGLGTSSSWSFESDQASAQLGWAVGSAGDVNGDTYGDVIVGAMLWDNGQTNEGKAWVFHGSSTGLATSSSWATESNQAGAYYGSAVSTAGDVNGDGYGDVIVGAYLWDNGQTNEGKVYVYHGSSTGLATSAAWTKESDQTSAAMGFSAANAGDINGDGYGDVIVGTYLYDNGETDEGMVTIYAGSSTGLGTTATWSGEGNQATAWYGYAVAGSGDIDGNGVGDFIVGGTKYDNGQTDEGRAWIYLSTLPDADGDGDPTSTDCNDNNAAIYHGATEVCNGVDDDCDGSIDEAGATGGSTYYLDSDSDGYGGSSSITSCSQPTGYVTTSTDCDDNAATTYPGAPELCDGIDNDCDGTIDDNATGTRTWYRDSDADTYGDAASSTSSCSQPTGYVSNSTDCNDSNPSIHPGASLVHETYGRIAAGSRDTLHRRERE